MLVHGREQTNPPRSTAYGRHRIKVCLLSSQENTQGHPAVPWADLFHVTQRLEKDLHPGQQIPLATARRSRASSMVACSEQATCQTMTVRGHGSQGLQHPRPRSLPSEDRRVGGDVPGDLVCDRRMPRVYTVEPFHCESLPRSSLSLRPRLSRSVYAGSSARRGLKAPRPWSGRVRRHCRPLARGRLCGSQPTSWHNHRFGWRLVDQVAAIIPSMALPGP